PLVPVAPSILDKDSPRFSSSTRMFGSLTRRGVASNEGADSVTAASLASPSVSWVEHASATVPSRKATNARSYVRWGSRPPRIDITSGLRLEVAVAVTIAIAAVTIAVAVAVADGKTRGRLDSIRNRSISRDGLVPDDDAVLQEDELAPVLLRGCGE